MASVRSKSANGAAEGERNKESDSGPPEDRIRSECSPNPVRAELIPALHCFSGLVSPSVAAQQRKRLFLKTTVEEKQNNVTCDPVGATGADDTDSAGSIRVSGWIWVSAPAFCGHKRCHATNNRVGEHAELLPVLTGKIKTNKSDFRDAQNLPLLIRGA